jgi:heme-degrading monooxygenase HmoA
MSPTNTQKQSVVVINTFFPHPGKLDEFVEMQREAVRRVIGDTQIPGFQGGRMYKAQDGTKAVLISVFDSTDAHKQFTKSDEFAAISKQLIHLIERTEPSYCDLVYETIPARAEL